MTFLNFLVLLWLAIVIPGFIYGWRLLTRASNALAWLKSRQLNGYREIVARGAIYRGQIRLVIFGCMVLMGANAAAIQFYPAGSEARQVLSALFRLLFILMAVAFSYTSWLEDHELDLLISEDQRRTARTRKGDQEDG
jgi:hypothetical protein